MGRLSHAHRGLITGVLGGGGPAPNLLDAFFVAYPPFLRWKMEAESGATELNVASTGESFNLSMSNIEAYQQDSGLPGAGVGLKFNGSSSVGTFASGAAINGKAEISILCIVHPETEGENSLGTILSKTLEYFIRFGSSAQITFQRYYSTTNALAIASTNSFVVGNTYAISAAVGADKVPHIYVNGEECTYSTQTTGVGTAASVDITGYVSGASNQVDGWIYDLAVVEGGLDSAAMLEHYQAGFLLAATFARVVGIVGTSITADPLGWRTKFQTSLTTTYPAGRFIYPGYYYNGGKTWEILWVLSTVLNNDPDIIILDAIGTVDSTPGRAEVEGFIRRVRTESPTTRVVVLIQPSWSGSTNVRATFNSDIKTLCDDYDCSYIDWSQRVADLIAAETYTQGDLFADTVHPSPTGHTQLALLVRETIDVAFVSGNDAWTGDIADYSLVYDDDYFSDTANYTSINSTDADSVTGTWSTVNSTERYSETLESTITFSFTGESWGFELDTDYDPATEIGVTVDGGSEVVHLLQATRPIIRMQVGMTRAAHTVVLRLDAGTFHIKRFLAI